MPHNLRLQLLLEQIEDFQQQAALVVKSESANIMKVEQLIDFADALDVYLPEAIKLREVSAMII